MPREARKKSRTNIYHIMMRGVNRQLLFEEDEDRYQYMEILKESKEIAKFRLHAFCLMDNHVHLLMEETEEPLEITFKRIGSKYAGWFNQKYQRTGHLFQDRFRSEIVETVGSFMIVLRYILQNPMKAGLEKQPGTYRWSSYLAYVNGTGSITDTQYAMECFGSRESLVDYVQQKNEDVVMDEDQFQWRLRDDEALEVMRRVAGCDSVADFQRLEREQMDQAMQEMYLAKLSMGQIARLTGMSKSRVHRAVQEMNPEQMADRKKIRLREAEFMFSEEEMENENG